MTIVNAVFGTFGFGYGILKAFVPESVAAISGSESVLNVTGLISGGAALGFYIKASQYNGAFTAAESILNLISSCLAIAFGTIHLLSFFGPNQPASSNCVYPSSDPACNTAQTAPSSMQSETVSFVSEIPLVNSPIL